MSLFDLALSLSSDSRERCEFAQLCKQLIIMYIEQVHLDHHHQCRANTSTDGIDEEPD